MPQARERLSSSKMGRLGAGRDGAAATTLKAGTQAAPVLKLEEGLAEDSQLLHVEA